MCECEDRKGVWLAGVWIIVPLRFKKIFCAPQELSD